MYHGKYAQVNKSVNNESYRKKHQLGCWKRRL